MPATVSTTSAPAAGVAGGDSTFTGDQHAIPVASVDEVERYEALLDSLLNEDDEVRDIPKEQEVIQRVPDEAYFGSKEYTKNFYGSHVTAEEQKEYLPLRRKVGQATLVRDQVSFRRAHGVAPWTLPAPCAYAFNRLPECFRPDFYKLYARVRNPLESAGALNETHQQNGEWNDTFSSEAMVAMLLTKSPPPIHTDPRTGKDLPPPGPLITLNSRQLNPNMKRLSIQLDSESYYSCCKVDKVCPELELRHWVEIIRSFSVEHARFSGGIPAASETRRISFDGVNLQTIPQAGDAKGTMARRLLSRRDFRKVLARDLRSAGYKAKGQFAVRNLNSIAGYVETCSRDESKRVMNDDARLKLQRRLNGEPEPPASLAEELARVAVAADGEIDEDEAQAIADMIAAAMKIRAPEEDEDAKFWASQLDPRWTACAALVHPHVEVLDMSCLVIRKDSLEVVSLLRRMAHLVLDRNDDITNEDLEPLKDCENLSKIEVSHCAGIRNLCALEACESLKEVVVRFCENFGVRYVPPPEVPARPYQWWEQGGHLRVEKDAARVERYVSGSGEFAAPDYLVPTPGGCEPQVTTTMTGNAPVVAALEVDIDERLVYNHNDVAGEAASARANHRPPGYTNQAEKKDLVVFKSKTAKHINVEGCHKMKNARMFAVVERLDLSHLQSLERVADCSFQYLRELNLSNNQSLTKVDDKVLFTAAPNIRSLNLRCCRNLRALSLKGAAKMELLFLNHCENLKLSEDELGRKIEVEMWPSSLKYADCYGCSSLTDAELIQALPHFPAEEHAEAQAKYDDSLSHEEGGHLPDVVGEVYKILKQDVLHLRAGSVCVVIDFWVDREDPENRWIFYLKPVQAAYGSAGSEPVFVFAEDEGLVFEAIQFEELDPHNALASASKGSFLGSIGVGTDTLRNRSKTTHAGGSNDARGENMAEEELKALMDNTAGRRLHGEQRGSFALARVVANEKAGNAHYDGKALGGHVAEKVRGRRGSGKTGLALTGRNVDELGRVCLVVWPNTDADFVRKRPAWTKQSVRAKFLKALQEAERFERYVDRKDAELVDDEGYSIVGADEVEGDVSPRANSKGPSLDSRANSKPKVQIAGRAKPDDVLYTFEEVFDGTDPDRHANDVRKELLDAIKRADEEGVEGFPLKRAVLPELLRLFPADYKIEDFLQPTKQNVVSISQYVEWEKNRENPNRREWHGEFLPHKGGLVVPDFDEPKKAPQARGVDAPKTLKKDGDKKEDEKIEPRAKVLKVMKGVRVADFMAFENVVKQLQRALRTWDMRLIKKAVTESCGPAHSRYVLKVDKRECVIAPARLLRETEKYFKHLEYRLGAAKFLSITGETRSVQVNVRKCCVKLLGQGLSPDEQEKEYSQVDAESDEKTDARRAQKFALNLFVKKEAPNAHAQFAVPVKTIVEDRGVLADVCYVLDQFPEAFTLEVHVRPEACEDAVEAEKALKFAGRVADNRAKLLCNVLIAKKPHYNLTPKGMVIEGAAPATSSETEGTAAAEGATDGAADGDGTAAAAAINPNEMERIVLRRVYKPELWLGRAADPLKPAENLDDIMADED